MGRSTGRCEDPRVGGRSQGEVGCSTGRWDVPREGGPLQGEGRSTGR